MFKSWAELLTLLCLSRAVEWVLWLTEVLYLDFWVSRGCCLIGMLTCFPAQISQKLGSEPAWHLGPYFLQMGEWGKYRTRRYATWLGKASNLPSGPGGVIEQAPLPVQPIGWILSQADLPTELLGQMGLSAQLWKLTKILARISALMLLVEMQLAKIQVLVSISPVSPLLSQSDLQLSSSQISPVN